MPAVKKKCEKCPSEFLVKAYRENSARFCSRKCKSVWMSEIRTGVSIPGHPAWNKGLKGIHLSPSSEFKTGSVPWNKEKKGIHLSPRSEFKRGLIPKNKVPVGTIKVRPDSQGHPRNWIKIDEPNSWLPYYRFIWQQAFGSIPDDKVLHHMNGIHDDDRLENLELLTRPEHARVHKKQL